MILLKASGLRVGIDARLVYYRTGGISTYTLSLLRGLSQVIGENENRTATIFYALVMTIAGLFNATIWLYASHKHRLIELQFPPQQITRETIRTLIVPGVFLVSIGLAFINPILAIYSWLLIAVALKFA